MYERIGTITEEEKEALLAECVRWSHKLGQHTNYWAYSEGPERMFIKIAPGGRVHKHSDHGFKKHTVLATNPQCVNFSDGRPYRLEERGVYRMDASLPHESVNHGTTDRIHLVEPG